MKFAFTLLAGLGILMALFGIGLDILPGTNPGLNLPQALLIITGLLLSLMAFRLRSADVRRRILGNAGKYLAPGLLIAFVTFLVLEFVLVAIGISTYFPPEIPETIFDPVSWWGCDEAGCHYIYDETVAACENGDLSGRMCIVNRQGFHDTQDFAAGDDFDGRMRILMLGDSFTFGYKADMGKSYVETVEANFPQSVVWNAGIPASGTNQALASFRAAAPVLQPQLTILGFYSNDFYDNLMPMDSWLWGVNWLDKRFAIRQYRVDRLGNAVKLDNRALYYRMHNVDPPANEIERLIGTTRLGALALHLIDAVRGLVSDSCDPCFERQVNVTRDYLTALRDEAVEQGTALLVLLIPHRDDIGAPGRLYQTAIQLMEELGIPWLDPAYALDVALDYAPKPDVHWNNAGHQKIGAVLSGCLAVFEISGDLADCEGVEMSSSGKSET